MGKPLIEVYAPLYRQGTREVLAVGEIYENAEDLDAQLSASQQQTWIVVCITATTLHTAAVPRDVIQATPEARMFFGLAPDRRWLQWVRGSTLHGPFAVPTRAFDTGVVAPGTNADFIIRYANRRKQLEAEPELRVNR